MGKKHYNVISLINESGVLVDQSQCRSKKSSLITYFFLLTCYYIHSNLYIQNYIRITLDFKPVLV